MTLNKKQKIQKFDYFPWIIVLVGLLIRLIYLGEVSAHNPYFHDETLVAEVHHQWAKDIITGNRGAIELFLRAPLYPYILAGLYWIMGVNTLYPRLLQLLLGTLLTYPIFLIGKNLFGRKSGLTAAIIWAFYGPEIFFEGELFETSMTVLLLFAVYFFWCQAEKNASCVWYFLAGIILGLSYLMKPNSGLFIPLLIVWFFVNRENKSKNLKALTLFFVGCIIVILPLVIRNGVISGKFVPFPGYSGLNIYIGNNPQSDGVSAILPGMVETEQDWEWGKKHHDTALTALSVRKASEALGRELSSQESSNYWWKKSRAFALQRPDEFLLLNLKKLVLYFSGFEYGNTRDLYFSRNYSAILSILLWNFGIKFPLGLLYPFSVLGIYYAFREKIPGISTILIFIFGAIFSTTLVFVCARFRMTAIPFLVILAGGGIIKAFETLNPRKMFTNLAIFIPIVLLSNINFFGLERDVAFEEYYNVGRFYLQKGEVQKGFEALQKSFQAKPDFIPTLNELGLLMELAGRYNDAVQYYGQVLKQTPLDAIANYNLGAAEGKAGDVSSALEHLSKAVELDATLWQAWLNLGNAHFFLNRPDSAQYCYHKALSLAPDSPDILYNLGNFYLTQKDKVQAVEYLQKAYDLAPEYPNLKELLENLRQNQK